MAARRVARVASKAPSTANVMAQAKKNLAATSPKPKVAAKPKVVKASKPKLPAVNRNLVKSQKKINKTAMW